MPDQTPLTDQELREVEALYKKYASLNGIIPFNEVVELRESFPRLVASVRAAREALGKYGRHKADCSWNHVPKTYRGDPCNCGFTAALGEAK